MEWLRPFNKTIRPSCVVEMISAPGDYILAFSSHFMPARCISGHRLQTNSSMRTHSWFDLRLCNNTVGRAVQKSQEGWFTLNPANLDAVFAVVPDDGALPCQQMGPALRQYQGGKTEVDSAQRLLQVWTEIQFQEAPAINRQVSATESDGSGFWEEVNQDVPALQDTYFHWGDAEWIWSPFPHRLVRIEDLESNADVRYSGGSLPADVLDVFPDYFLAPAYQSRLAACSRGMLRCVRRSSRWLNLDLNFAGPDFNRAEDLRSMTVLCRSASSLRMEVPQLAQLLTIPINVRVQWSPRNPIPPGPVRGFFSSSPLLGVASFSLKVPPGVTSLQMGSRQLHGFRNTFVRIKNVCAVGARPRWYFGVTGRRPSLYEPASSHSFTPRKLHQVVFRWSQRFLSVTLDDVLVAAGLLQPGEVSGAPPLATFFFSASTEDVEFNPMPSPVMRNAKIVCAICDREYTVAIHRWRVCPDCNNWVCSRHVADSPFRRCPTCPAQLLDYIGGADACFLPPEIVLRLPEHFFSLNYLRSLATCCTALRRHVLQPLLWCNKDLFLNDEDMREPAAVRQMETLWSLARTIVCTQTQLASMRQPALTALRALIEWQVAPIRLDRVRHASIESTHCLLGTARFCLWLSAEVREIYVGVKSFNSNRRSFVKMHELFTERMGFSFGMTGQALDPDHRPMQQSQLRANGWNQMMLMWNERWLAVQLNHQTLGCARIRQDLPDGPAPQSIVFVWAKQPKRLLTQPDLKLRPLPSPLLPSAHVQCLLCEDERPITVGRWRVCPECCSWICARHAHESPSFQCPGCPLQLSDYIGGSSGVSFSSRRKETGISYRDAVDFFLKGGKLEGGDDKFENVVLKLLRDHEEFLRETPAAVQLIPAPQARAGMSKRTWERLMYRARAILDFLDQKQDLLLFRFLHAEAEDLATSRQSPLLRLRHPATVDDSEAWRSIAMDCALQLHVLLFHQQQTRGRQQHVPSGASRVQTTWTETFGGALPVDDHGAHELQLGNGLNFFQWQRLSRSRATAFTRRRQTRNASEDQSESSFHVQWESGCSPACCPTYGAGTSFIRVPSAASFQCAAPKLTRVPTNFLEMPRTPVEASFLAEFNPHSRDLRVSFLAQSHVYKVDGAAMSTSVTGLVHSYSQPFDAAAAIQSMKRSSRWPRAEYSKLQDGNLVEMTSDEIRQLWQNNSQEAANRGTWMHLQLEVLLNGGYASCDCIEVQLFQKFLAAFSRNLLAYRTEWCIFSKEDSVAGCIDFVAQASDGSLVLFDWKRTKQLRSKYNNPWRNMMRPLQEIPDVAGWHYRLQLNLYKYIIERHYGFTVSGMYVVCLHPDNSESGPFVDDVPDLENEVLSMVQHHRQRCGAAWQEMTGGASNLEPDPSQQYSFEEMLQQELDEERQAEDDERQVVESVPDAQLQVAIPSALTPEAMAAAKRRRLQPGASTTAAAFQSFFDSATSAYQTSLRNWPETQAPSGSGNIKQQTQRILQLVRQERQHWSEEMIRMAAAAITVYRTRYTDIFVHDFVGLIWIIEGERFLRAHRGVCYLYHDSGAFEAFNGVPPESTFHRLKNFLLKLEGMFRLMSVDVQRSDSGVLREMSRLRAEYNSDEEFMNVCKDEAIMTLPGRPGSARRRQGGEADAAGWPTWTADMLGKFIGPLQKDLLEERILS